MSDVDMRAAAGEGTAEINAIDASKQAIDLALQGVDDDAALACIKPANRRDSLASLDARLLRQTPGVYAHDPPDGIRRDGIESIADAHAIGVA